MSPLDDVAGRPGNEFVLERLRELMASDQAIAFVGAGASAGLYPTWDALVRKLADEAVRRGSATDEDRATWLRIAPRNPQQAVRGIKDSLGRQVYGAVLARIFGYQTGDDGKPFTPVHRLLLELPFRGYVTTNYDPGLVEARAAVRVGVRATGYATWQDADSVRRWQTGEVFGEPHACPVLYAHGIYEKSDTIVLGVGEYRQAYQAGAFRELVGKLWSQERLVFVGFGFTDTWFDVVAEQVLGLTARQAAGEPRHIAILGLPEDEPYSPQLREYFRDAYDAEMLLYPVRVTEHEGVEQQDHSPLQAIMEALPRPFAGPPPGRPSPRAAQAASPQRWVHETTDDDRYIEPAGVLSRLDRWVADPKVRTIAITGIGGLGKTALVGHWLKNRNAAAGRQAAGLFAWSFNADRQVEHFLAGLVEFATDVLALRRFQRGTRPVDAAIAVLRTVPLVVVLDGLEVLQAPPGKLVAEGPGQLGYGEFLDDDLRAFLDAACRLPQQGLVVMTSRFPFADMTEFLGSTLRLLPLERLSPAEGADLLRRLDVRGDDQDRQTISVRLDGHPLALRVFAAGLARQAHHDPARLLDAAFGAEGLRDDDPLEAKLRQLLAFYQTQLPDAWQALLGVVALFPDQVGVGTALELARRLPRVAARLQVLADAQVRVVLATLASDGLLTRELDRTGQELYACHPIIRSHFRAALVASHPGFAAEAAKLLTGAASGQVKSIEELEVVTNAIGLLLDAGEILQANALYHERIGPQPMAFIALLAPREGLQCALGFVADQHRRDQIREELSPGHLAFYLNEVGLYARNAAEFELANGYYRESVELSRTEGDDRNLPIDLGNLAEMLIDIGLLADAEVAAREAVELTKRNQDLWQEHIALAWLGAAIGLQGQTAEAVTLFESAREVQQRTVSIDVTGLYGTPGLQWAELLMRLGRDADARAVTEANLVVCERTDRHDDAARCHRLLGHLKLRANEREPAATHLNTAEAALRAAHLLPELGQVLLVQAELARRREALDTAERHIEEVLTLASSRRMALHHADALVLRGRLQLGRGQAAEAGTENGRRRAEQALDDADDARNLAQRCGYAWAERDAALVVAEAHTMLGDAESAREARRHAEQLDHRIRPAS